MTTAAASAPRHARALPRLRSLPLPRPELGALLVLAAVLNLWALDANGWANEYYSAAVRSMSESWNAFLFGTFDASGVMTVDKPPLALWVQALSARVFGFHSLSILVPQALMGMATVALVYDLVRRRFGRRAGFVAGLVLALTPITVAISRHNNPDALLILCCTGALWALVRALEDGRTRWLVLCGALVGLGFEAKMAVALMVVPGIVAAYLWVAPKGRLAALRQLLAGGAAMVVAGGFWPVIVALTPASERPWISGTADNSIWSLILGYNGLGRLTGQAGGPAGAAAAARWAAVAGRRRVRRRHRLAAPARPEHGRPGRVVPRLRDRLRRRGARRVPPAPHRRPQRLADRRRRRVRDDRRRVLLRAGDLPPVLRLAAGAVHRRAGRRGRRAALRGRDDRPRARAARRAGGRRRRGDDPARQPAVAHVAAGRAGAPPGSPPPRRSRSCRRRAIALGAALGALLIAPAAWSAETLGHATSGTFPAGGPQSAGTGMGGPGGPAPAAASRAARRRARCARRRAGARPAAPRPRPAASGRGGGMFGGDSAALTEALAYTRAHGGGTIAVSSQSGAGGQVIEGAEVAAIGGFSGNESEVSASWLAESVRAGKIRWVLTSGDGRGGISDGRTGSRSVMAAVQATCNPVDSVDGLYDCQGEEAALAASTA